MCYDLCRNVLFSNARKGQIVTTATWAVAPMGNPRRRKWGRSSWGRWGVFVYLCTCVLARGVWQLGGEGVGKEWSFEGDGTIMIDLVPAASLFALYIFARPMICPRICGTCICFKCHPNNHWCKLVWEVWDISGPIGNLNCWPNKLEFNEKMVYKITSLRTFFPLWKTLTEEVSTTMS